ncbi:hypothetical protein CW751_00860 [Brumimicrobium salinarum]|uniref:Uncharacterized protein n=1 Tax=Brumimicrobium salinarum TaxID=2058658 RepID=A0A2I0R5R1_9FLAO|nr:hypothetical protein [Brumimicrobium salinarum]PKR81918.1 hypothetical protein CW751_00860 [Brumimicrobium salinarum]
MSKSKSFLYSNFLLFGVLGVIFIPFTFRNWNFQAEMTQFLFEDLLLGIGNSFEWIKITNPEISSDSTTFYLLILVLFLIAIFLISILQLSGFWKKHQYKIFNIFKMILVYYLALIMLKYGFDKVFKAQFYLPEPNLLFTPLGKLDKDILYWSTIGSSYFYNIFIGLMEVIPALMLLFKRTRILGLFILSGVLIHVLFVNLGFDISVKLFSFFLLFINLLLLAPSIKKIIQFFVMNKSTSLPYLTYKNLIYSKVIRFSIKGIVVLFIFSESLFPYIQSGNYNDDTVPRNPLHGAYEISISKSKGLPENFDIKRFFIHRQHYFIFQYADDSMEDYKLEVLENQLILTDYDGVKIELEYNYSEDDKSLEIKSEVFGWTIYGEGLNWRKMPLMEEDFHWSLDNYEG